VGRAGRKQSLPKANALDGDGKTTRASLRMEAASASDIGRAAAVQVIDKLLSPSQLRGDRLKGDSATSEILQDAISQASAAILRLAADRPEWIGMASTVVIGVIRGGTLHIANLGDTRAYLIRDGDAQILTEDHSVAASLAEMGQMSAEEARNHPLRNQLTAALGIKDSRRAHYIEAPLVPDDRVLLCSDGLWDMVPDADICRLVTMHRDPAKAVRALIGAANDAGGHDNITATLVAVLGENKTPEHDGFCGADGGEHR
jgi:serine/threonine protein phosphatase PrpC